MRFLTLVATLLISIAAFADRQTLSETTPELDTAIDAWLDDRDDVAIPMLAELAAAGDEDAMILLGQIARRSYAFSKFLDDIGRKERNALIKAPGGLSGTTWLRQVVQQKDLADALLGIDNPGNRAQSTAKLLDMDEHGQAIRQLLRQLDGPEGPELFRLAQRPDFPTEIRVAPWTVAVWYPHLAPSALEVGLNLSQGLSALEAGELQGYIFARFNEAGLKERLNLGASISERDFELGWLLWTGRITKESEEKTPDRLTDREKDQLRAEVLALLADTPETRGIVSLCSRYCPNSREGCTWAIYDKIGGYFSLIEVQSPVEKLIPSSRYFASPRYEADMVRKIKSDLYSPHGEVYTSDTCATKLVNTLAQ